MLILALDLIALEASQQLVLAQLDLVQYAQTSQVLLIAQQPIQHVQQMLELALLLFAVVLEILLHALMELVV